MYILALIISSLCVAKQYKRSVTERETDSRRRREKTSNSSYTPAALQINTNRDYFTVSKTLLRMYKSASVFNTNKTISSKSFKYSTKCTINMEWRCEPGGKIHYLLTCFVACSFK